MGVRMRIIMSVTDIFKIIEPADPDSISHIGNGYYEASWSPANPHEMDIALIRGTEGITITHEPFRPENMPNGWWSIEFAISSGIATE